jgi:hypothetical protein
LQSDGEGLNSEGLAIDNPSPSPEIAWERPQVQPLIPLPGIIRNNAHAVVAHVFCKALLRGVANIETTEIHSYGQRNTPFQSSGDGLHETPHGLTQNWLVGVGGGNDRAIILYPGPDSIGISGLRRILASENPDN